MLDAIILAGGKGTRLRAVVSDKPKPLADVNGRPFLDYQLEMLARSGRVRRVVLAVGYMADKIRDHYTAAPPALPLSIVEETELLGTGGGLANALDATSGDRVLALNGDSVFRWALEPLERALAAASAPAAALGLVHVDDLARFGGVQVDAGGRITAFREKEASAGVGLINGGVYLFDRAVLAALPRGRVVSLEREIFPAMAAGGRLGAAVFDSDFIDIGLPETYAAAPAILPSLIR